jgi:hypothetical protein
MTRHPDTSGDIGGCGDRGRAPRRGRWVGRTWATTLEGEAAGRGRLREAGRGRPEREESREREWVVRRRIHLWVMWVP